MYLKSGLALSAAILAVALTGCASPSRFEWGNYEGSLYAYAKKPELRSRYRESVEKAIADGRRTHRLAPGMLAELGYLDLEDGNTPEAVKLFRQEIEAFPESQPFLEKVISRSDGNTAKPSQGGTQ